jgi:hypothetical protein
MVRFSQRFLPRFDKFAQDKTRTCARVSTDDKASLFEKDSVEVVPAILGIRKGKTTIWLDAVSGEGLTEKQQIPLMHARGVLL